MKKNVLLVALMMMSTIIFAQRHLGDSKDRVGKHADRMKKELSLNDDQYNRVKDLDSKFAESRLKLKADTAISVGASRTQMKKLGEAREAQLKDILTSEQWTKWAALKEKHRESRKNPNHKKSGK